MINLADCIYQNGAGVAIGTVATSIFTKPVIVNTGVYHFKFQVNLTNVGSPTNINFGLSGPTATNIAWELIRHTGSGSTPLIDVFTSVADAVAGTAVVTTWAKGEGAFKASSATAFNIRAIRVAGTSSTVAAGSFFICERIG